MKKKTSKQKKMNEKEFIEEYILPSESDSERLAYLDGGVGYDSEYLQERADQFNILVTFDEDNTIKIKDLTKKEHDAIVLFQEHAKMDITNQVLKSDAKIKKEDIQINIIMVEFSDKDVSLEVKYGFKNTKHQKTDSFVIPREKLK